MLTIALPKLRLHHIGSFSNTFAFCSKYVAILQTGQSELEFHEDFIYKFGMISDEKINNK